MATSTSDTASPLDGVAQTALWTADMRARESAGPALLSADPFAERFVKAGGGFPEPRTDPLTRQVLADWLAVRTRFYDDYLMNANRSGCRQIVILGAGLDTRALRLDWSDETTVYEVDLPALHAFKDQALAEVPHKAPARRVPVPADLAGAWHTALTEAGLNPGQPTAWLFEGAVFYFSEPEVEHIVETITGLSALGSTVGADCLNADRGRSELMDKWLAVLTANGTPVRWQLSDAERWWADRGWSAHPADLRTLPYAVDRLAPYQQLRDKAQGDPMLLISGTRRSDAGRW